MTATSLTLDRLDLSPFNVRRDPRDIGALDALAASILAQGLLLPLVVHPFQGRRSMFGVFAGGRRLRAIRLLVDRGDLPADTPIAVIVRDLGPRELVELSTAENLLRRDLRPYEVAAAVASAHRKGGKPREIAAALGQEQLWVERQLRLGLLAKPVFEALEADRISLEQAQAIGATEDLALQAQVFAETMARPEHERTPARIRARLRLGDEALGRLLRFVGADTYREAGGALETDLFADEAGADVTVGARVVDEALLRRLADAQLADVRDDVRTACGRPELRFVPAPPAHSGGHGVDYALEIHPVEGADGVTLPGGDVVAHLKLGEDGPEVSYWWASRAAKHGHAPKAERARPPAIARPEGAAIDDRASPGATAHANAELREAAGLDLEGVQILRSLRRAALRAAFVGDARSGGSLARDYLVWTQIRALLQHRGETSLGLVATASPATDPEAAQPHLDASPAHRIWLNATRELARMPFVQEPRLDLAFGDFREQPHLVKRLAGAVVAGWRLERSLAADGYRLEMHEELGRWLGLDDPAKLRMLLPPTAALLDLLPKAERAAIAEPFVERAVWAPWPRLRSAELTSRVLAVLQGAGEAMRASTIAAARRWVHPLLRFGGDAANAPEQTPAPAAAAAMHEQEIAA